MVITLEAAVMINGLNGVITNIVTDPKTGATVAEVTLDDGSKALVTAVDGSDNVVVATSKNLDEAGKVVDDVGKHADDVAHATKTLDTIFEGGNVSLVDLKANPKVFSGKSVDEVAEALKDCGYEVRIRGSSQPSSKAQIIEILNNGNGKNIVQVQVSPGGGRHGDLPYVKISTTDQGKIKIIDGLQSAYKTDGAETATLIFAGE